MGGEGTQKTRNVFSHSLEGPSPQSRCEQGHAPSCLFQPLVTPATLGALACGHTPLCPFLHLISLFSSGCQSWGPGLPRSRMTSP